MGRGPARFKQSDVARALRAAKREGAAGVKINPDGSIDVTLSPTLTEDQELETAKGKEIVL